MTILIYPIEVTLSVDRENKTNLRLQSWLLAARLAVVSIGVILIPSIQIPVATFLGIILAVIVVALLMTSRDCWLPYCYLGAAALWAGYGAGLCIYGATGSIFLFIACLVIVDASSFIASWKRRWL